MAPQDGLTATLTRAETTAPTLQRSAPLLRVDGLSVSYGPHEVVSPTFSTRVPKRQFSGILRRKGESDQCVGLRNRV